MGFKDLAQCKNFLEIQTSEKWRIVKKNRRWNSKMAKFTDYNLLLKKGIQKQANWGLKKQSMGIEIVWDRPNWTDLYSICN